MQLTTNIAAIGSVLLCLALASGSAIADQGSAFYEGKSFAGPKIQGYNDSIKSGAFQAPLTGHNSMYPSETQHYGDGNGLVREAGSFKLQNCNSYAPGWNTVANQECEAVNFLARNPDIRPHFNLGKSDPMLTKARSIRDNADAIFKTLGINWADGGGNNCTTTTVTAPALYTTEICSTMRDLGEEQCTMGRKIEIDADSRFQCMQTINAYEFPKCRRKFNVECSEDSGTIPNVTVQASKWWCDNCDGRPWELAQPFIDAAMAAGNTVTTTITDPEICKEEDGINCYYSTKEYKYVASGGSPVTITLNATVVGTGYTFIAHPGGMYGVISIDGNLGFKHKKPWIYASALAPCPNKVWVGRTKDYPGHWTCPNTSTVCPAGSEARTINGSDACIGNLVPFCEGKWTETAEGTSNSCATLEARSK